MHDNIVPFIGACVELPNLAMVYQHMRGGDLYSLLVEKRAHAGGFTSADWPLLVRFCLDAAKGLAFAHAEHIVHRDIALRNLLLDGELRGLTIDADAFSFCSLT